ncbi:hypothetical protein JCM3774_002083 [Rhodotorula dairenensis]
MAVQRPPACLGTPLSWCLSRSTHSAAKGDAAAAAPPGQLTASAEQRRPRYDGLATLEPAAHRLAFRSIPYGSPPHVVFPPAHVPQFTTSNRYFTLRCFPSQSRTSPNSIANANAPAPAPSPKRSHPTPPPSLIGTTDPDLDLSSPFLRTPEDRRRRLAQVAKGRKPYTVDLTLFASKKKVHKSAVIRERCKRRCREAIRLVVVRNASSSTDGNDEGALLLQEDDLRELGPRKWLLPGYHYIMNITLETYRGPLPDLVAHLRAALKTVKTKAEAAALAAQLAEIEIAPRTRLPDGLRSDAETA